MADKLAQKVPGKGILKSSSFDKNEPLKSHKEMKWDEMNILQTLHPPDKDYGHMKINEPKTPYSYYKDSEERSDDEVDGLDADLLARKIQLGSSAPPKALMADEDESESDEDETDEQKANRKLFEQKRKIHYNEYYAVKLARKLMEHDEEEDEEDEHKSEEEEDEDENDDDDDVSSSQMETSAVSGDQPTVSSCSSQTNPLTTNTESAKDISRH